MIAALLAAWAPFVPAALRGIEPDWKKFAEETADAAREHINSAKRLAMVLLFLLFCQDIVAGLSWLNPNAWIRKRSEKEFENDSRPDELGDMVAKTSSDRWRSLPENPSREDLQRWVERNLGRDRAEMVAATEITDAQTRGESAARTILDLAGLSLKAIWVTERNPCPVCKSLNGTDESVWANFFPLGPPSPHPGCRCHLRYVRARLVRRTASYLRTLFSAGSN